MLHSWLALIMYIPVAYIYFYPLFSGICQICIPACGSFDLPTQCYICSRGINNLIMYASCKNWFLNFHNKMYKSTAYKTLPYESLAFVHFLHTSKFPLFKIQVQNNTVFYNYQYITIISSDSPCDISPNIKNLYTIIIMMEHNVTSYFNQSLVEKPFSWDLCYPV